MCVTDPKLWSSSFLNGSIAAQLKNSLFVSIQRRPFAPISCSARILFLILPPHSSSKIITDFNSTIYKMLFNVSLGLMATTLFTAVSAVDMKFYEPASGVEAEFEAYVQAWVGLFPYNMPIITHCFASSCSSQSLILTSFQPLRSDRDPGLNHRLHRFLHHRRPIDRPRHRSNWRDRDSCPEAETHATFRGEALERMYLCSP